MTSNPYRPQKLECRNPNCDSNRFVKEGFTKDRKQKMRCKKCKKFWIVDDD